MEKSGKLQLTMEEYNSFLLGQLSPSLAGKGVSSLAQLKEILDSDEYEIISV